jgi:RNA polymerase sigma-70 factor (ECF subfamily)
MSSMPPEQYAAQRFEEHRGHLKSVAYRMLGSLAEADDAVQEAWLRLARAGGGDGEEGIRDLRAWLTTVVSRVCLDMLRSRAARREDSYDVDAHVPDPIVTPVDEDPAEHAALADSVGIALLVVLDTLSPPERLAFVLHDVFAMPFEQVGAILDRTPDAAKQLASRARRRLRGAPERAAPRAAPAELARQWQAVEAFQSAAGSGDFGALLEVLAPDVVLRADAGAYEAFGGSRLVRGAAAVAAQAREFAPLARYAHRVLVNGGPGFVVAPGGKPLSLLAVTVIDDRITEIDVLADPARLARLDLTALLEPE